MPSGDHRFVYPAPTLVVGVGRFGLALLERLGEDWHDLAQAGADPTLQNLRLLAVRSAPDHGPEDWRRGEERTAAVAAYVDDSDQPSLALDFAILRSLGLVRYRNGNYQVAVPRDAGVVEMDEKGGPTRAPGTGAEARRDAGRHRLERRRFFAWSDLAPDPVTAAERLHRMAERSSELDLFVTPVLARVRQGHSPRTLLITIARAAAFKQGRDPSPWDWLRKWLRGSPDGDDGALRLQAASPAEVARCFGAAVDLAASPGDAAKRFGEELAETGGGLERFAPEPLAGWNRWLEHWQPAGDSPLAAAGLDGDGATAPILELRIPAPFVPDAEDLGSWFDPLRLLEMDWQSSGWAAELADSSLRPFKPSPASPFRLGLFDHDATAAPRTDHLPGRLARLGELVHKGLVRLWIDLQRERVDERQPSLDSRRREHDEEGLRQSLQILGELLVRGLTDEVAACTTPRERASLPQRPSRFLQSIVAERARPASEVVSALAARLAELELGEPGTAPERHPLFHDVLLAPEHLDESPRGAPALRAPATRGAAEPAEDPRSGGSGDLPYRGLPALRRVLNREVRHLFEIEHLAAYRTRPTRTPPRLTVFLVGDMGEPFARAAMRPLLREIHGELLRAFTPILEDFREGFDRGLAVLPILWTPHPADPFEGDGGVAGRCEEAAIINALHGVRRWCESVIPATRRRVSQIFVNSRVTDLAVLDTEDAVRQTRDFITFQVRSDLARDDWLRTTAQGSRGDDFFSSFTCYEIDFPAEKAREYLANRLARDAMNRLKTAQDEQEVEDVPGELLEPPRLAAKLDAARQDLVAALEPPAEQLAEEVLSRGRVDRSTPVREVEERFGPACEGHLLGEVQRHWRGLVEDRGGMDHRIDDLRRLTSELRSRRVVEVQRNGDRLVEEHAGRGGVQAALAAFHRLRDAARGALQQAEDRRRHQEDLVRRHAVPATGVIGDGRRRVLAAADDVPQQPALRLGLLLWLAMAPALGAPLAHTLLGFLDAAPGSWPARLLGTWGWVPGGALLVGAAAIGLRLFQDHRLQRLRRQVATLAQTVRRLLLGHGDDPAREATASLRSFFETRLLLAEALAARGFALHLFERVETDTRLAERIDRSIDVQATVLARQAEALGVRPTLGAGPEGTLARHPESDDVTSLFTPRSGKRTDRLISPERIVELYSSWSAGGSEIQHLVPRLLAAAGGFEAWRESACLSDTAALLEVGRGEFQDLVDRPLPQQHRFAEEVGERLCRFVARYYSNIGFGARFRGYEGLDPDGVQLSAEEALVLHEDLAPVFAQARQTGPATTRSLQVLKRPIRPSAAYMLSLAQGIRAHSVRNLRRFESFHSRSTLPEDAAFPLSGEMQETGINHLTGYRDIADRLHDLFRPAPAASPGGNGTTAPPAAARSKP
ncbi:MAG TPA: hypothetical protein VHQ65_11040 [Thermoanaerobaculia bacterium]|nr:hypothetical protein [Thermoanaerobaculia bacterium]